jgi:acyl-coenzyme A synthetase/AMP-(fatty) acid ligase
MQKVDSFFRHFDSKSGNTFLIDADRNISLTYAEAGSIINNIALGIKQHNKKLAFLFCDNSYTSLLAYLALLKSGNAVLLLNSRLNEAIKYSLISLYKPEIIFSQDQLALQCYSHKGSDGVNYYTCDNESHQPVYHNLAVLLSTSGTTGSPKLVRLSYRNIVSNAESIADYLNLQPSERAVTSLPMSYSYGLSVINSHIIAGASLMLTDTSFIFRDFWNLFNQHKCTSFAGVPYSYSLLKKSRFYEISLPSLRTLTQAGGSLDADLTRFFHDYASSAGINFYVMYGQTEATARIAYLPPQYLPQKIGSAGIPVPGGKIDIINNGVPVTEAGKTGEIVYSGANVMLGYAECREDLSRGDELNGILYTGDLGYKDDDGFCFITGRLKKFVKIFGLRINTDEVEKILHNKLHIEAVCCGSDDRLCILAVSAASHSADDLRRELSSYFNLNANTIFVKLADKIPVTESGKTDYKAVAALF